MINKKPLINFIIWCFVLFLICIIGITNVSADTYPATQFNAWLYDNYGPSLHYTTTDFTNNRWQGTIPSMTAYTSGGAWGISSPVVLLSGHTYSLSANITGYYSGNIVLSTYNRIGVGTTINNAITSYQNNSNVNENYSTANGTIIQFAFTPTSNGNYIVFPFATSISGSNQTFWLENIIIDDLGSSGVSETTINNSLNNQTNILNNSITASTNDITTNSNNNRDAIINNQNANNDALIENDNANTDKIIDENKKNFNDCHDSVNLANITSVTARGYTASLTDDIITITGTSSTVGDVRFYTNNSNLVLQANKTYTLSLTTTGTISGTGYKVIYLILNGSWKQLGSLTNNFKYTYTPTQNETLSQIILDLNKDLTFNNYTIKVQIQEGSTATDYEKYGEEICVNKLDEQKNAINNLNDSITSDNVDDSDIGDAFDDFNDFLDDNSTITQLITLPVTLYTAILNNLNGSCSPFNLGSLFGTDLILPCINISQYLGNSLWTMIDIIISGFAIYEIAKKFIKVFNNLSSLREGDVIDD